jgi:hypothetical protein
MNMQNTHTTYLTIQNKFDCFGMLLADLWLAACGAHSMYQNVHLVFAPRGRTRTQLSCDRFADSAICKIPNWQKSKHTLKMNTNIILFMHSFGGLSPPKTAQGNE